MRFGQNTDPNPVPAGSVFGNFDSLLPTDRGLPETGQAHGILGPAHDEISQRTANALPEMVKEGRAEKEVTCKD